MSPFWNLLELRMMEVVVMTGARMMEVVVTTGAIRRTKLQSNHHQQTNTQVLQVGCSTNSVKALTGRKS